MPSMNVVDEIHHTMATTDIMTAENARLKERIEKLERDFDEERAWNAEQTMNNVRWVLNTAKPEEANQFLVDFFFKFSLMRNKR